MYHAVARQLFCSSLLGLLVLAVNSNAHPQAATVPPMPSAVSQSRRAPATSPHVLEQAEATTIEQLERMAEDNNPTLVQAARRVQAMQGRQLQVGLYPNPVIGYQAEEIGVNGQAGQHGMYVRQEVMTANKLGLNRAVASEEVRQAEWEYRMQRLQVRNDVRTRAYEVLAAQMSMDVAAELVSIGETAVDVAERLGRAREVSQVDILQARVEANSANLQLVAARRAHAAAWRRLATVVGSPAMQPTPIAGSLDEELPELSWEETVTTVLSESPQVGFAQSGVERARHAVARARAGRTPNVETAANVRYNDDSSDTTLSLQVGVPLMIFDRNQGNIVNTNAELIAAQREVQRVTLSLRDQLATVCRDYETAREQVEEYRRDILPYAEQSLELTRTGYEQGEFDYLKLLAAQQTFSRTNLDYIDRLRRLWRAAVQIDGLLLTGGLQAPES